MPVDHNRQQERCPDKMVAVSNLAVAAPLQHLDAPQFFDLAVRRSIEIPRGVPLSLLSVDIDSSGPPDIPAFAVLRI